MTYTKYSSLLFIFIVLLTSCPYGYKYDIGIFPETPVNFAELNTEYDDYNATVPTLGQTFPLCFSSTRNSAGNEFDIVYKLISINFSRIHGTLDIVENTSSNLDVYVSNLNIKNALSKINTDFNEIGPYLIGMGTNYNENSAFGRYEMYFFLYSNDINGNQNIRFTHNLDNENYETPIEVAGLNSEFDDIYPTFNEDYSKLYFSSNRDQSYSIYYASFGNSSDLFDMLTDTTNVSIHRDSMLSSSFEDKSPSISTNRMVFASNREGGYGGYDLYYSYLENGIWTEPKNFGNTINTQYNEYRPIVKPHPDFSNDFMIFSSDRPEGKGGFDLYYVGIRKVPENY